MYRRSAGFVGQQRLGRSITEVQKCTRSCRAVLEGVYNRSTEMYKVIVERYSFDKAFKAGNGRLSYDEFDNVLQSNGCILSGTELKKACSEYDLDHNGFIQYEDFDRIFEGIANIVPSSRYINSKFGPLRFAARTFVYR